MQDLLSRGALPLGMLMFAGMVVALLVRRARAHRAARDFPSLAEKLGLEYRPPTPPRSIGTLAGWYRGYRVYIDPDEQRRIMVRFDGEPLVDLRSYAVSHPRPRTMRTYYSGDRQFDSFFKTRFAGETVSKRLGATARPSRLLTPFRGPYDRALKQLNITSNGVSCILDFGNPPHIPAAAVELLLPAMIALAEVIEPRDA